MIKQSNWVEKLRYITVFYSFKRLITVSFKIYLVNVRKCIDVLTLGTIK